MIGGREEGAFRRGTNYSKEEIGDFLEFAVLQSGIMAKRILQGHSPGQELAMGLKVWASKELLPQQQ